MTTLIFSYGYPPADGGIEVYSAGIANGLWEQGESVVVLAPHFVGCETLDIRQPFPIYRVPAMLFLREWCMLLFLPWLVRKHKVDRILNTVWLPCGSISWLVTRLLRIPYFISAHGSEILDTQNLKNPLKHMVRKRLRWLKIITLRNACAIFAVSEFTRHLVISQGISPDRVFTILNGVDTKRFRPLDDVAWVRSKHNLKGCKVILTLGRLDDYKGHDTVIRALPQILKEVPQAVYLIVGRGSEKEKLERLAEEEKVSEHVVFAGYVPDEEIVSYYNVCDVFVMISRQDNKDMEGFGLVYLEANACKKAVIGGDSGGVRDAIVHGETGLLVDPLDTKAVAHAIIHLLSNHDEALRMGKNGLQRVENELDWVSVAKRIWLIMERVAA
jgi:phosphatidylinositol alpha-1,6-mannosyltransferase